MLGLEFGCGREGGQERASHPVPSQPIRSPPFLSHIIPSHAACPMAYAPCSIPPPSAPPPTSFPAHPAPTTPHPLPIGSTSLSHGIYLSLPTGSTSLPTGSGSTSPYSYRTPSAPGIHNCSATGSRDQDSSFSSGPAPLLCRSTHPTGCWPRARVHPLPSHRSSKCGHRANSTNPHAQKREAPRYLAGGAADGTWVSKPWSMQES